MTARQSDKRNADCSAEIATYFGHAAAGLDEPGGRFAAKPTVIGTTPTAQYPAAAGPWSPQADVGIEPALGVAIDDVEPVGEAFEVERSLESLGEVAAPVGSVPPAVETASPDSTRSIKRRKL